MKHRQKPLVKPKCTKDFLAKLKEVVKPLKPNREVKHRSVK